MKPMVNQPDQDTQGLPEPSGKLVLPASLNEGQYLQPYTVPIRPEQLIRRPASSDVSHSLLTRLTTLWHKDPAYRVLSLGIVLVLLASIIFVAFGVNALMSGSSSGSTWSQAYTEHPAAPTPAGTVDDKPTFATPVTGKGSNQSSLPPSRPIPNLYPTPSTNQQGNLQVQIVSIPNPAPNNSRVHVQVQTSEPGATVMLQVTYNAAPYFYVSGSHTTDGNGNATISWTVKVNSLRGGFANATVVVIAADQNGQQASSQAVTVTIQ
jgi:hypothetical protein